MAGVHQLRDGREPCRTGLAHESGATHRHTAYGKDRDLNGLNYRRETVGTDRGLTRFGLGLEHCTGDEVVEHQRRGGLNRLGHVVH